MSNKEQIDYWNGDAGKRWAQQDETMARLLEPVCAALLDHAAVERCERALDIGCGGGSQSLMLAQRMQGGSSVLGVDVSAPMLAVAQLKKAETDSESASLDFLHADASTYTFEAGAFDLLFSRFGVMFFDDPSQAFQNLHSALSDTGRLAFCCWQSLADNAWTLLPIQAALQYVEKPEAADPNAPGPFSFADPARVRSILEGAGFSAIEIAPHIIDVRFGQDLNLADSVRELAGIGPVSRLLVGVEDAVQQKVFSAMEEVLAPYYKDGGLVLPGAVWFVSANG
ncbi:MAG: class I SAM-dependent methyltransferase [Halioglobus sp.]